MILNIKEPITKRITVFGVSGKIETSKEVPYGTFLEQKEKSNLSFRQTTDCRESMLYYVSVFLRDFKRHKEDNFNILLVPRIESKYEKNILINFFSRISSFYGSGLIGVSLENIIFQQEDASYEIPCLVVSPSFFTDFYSVEALSLFFLLVEGVDLNAAFTIKNSKNFMDWAINQILEMHKNRGGDGYKYIWTSLYLSTLFNRGIPSMSTSNGPASTALAFCKPEDVVNMVKNDISKENKSFVMQHLTNYSKNSLTITAALEVLS